MPLVDLLVELLRLRIAEEDGGAVVLEVPHAAVDDAEVLRGLDRSAGMLTRIKPLMIASFTSSSLTVRPMRSASEMRSSRSMRPSSAIFGRCIAFARPNSRAPVFVARHHEQKRGLVILRLDAGAAHGGGARLREARGLLASARIELDDEDEDRRDDDRPHHHGQKATTSERVNHRGNGS